MTGCAGIWTSWVYRTRICNVMQCHVMSCMHACVIKMHIIYMYMYIYIYTNVSIFLYVASAPKIGILNSNYMHMIKEGNLKAWIAA